MSVNLSLFAGAGWQFFTDNGIPLSGGLLYTYTAGSTSPETTYIDSAGVTQNANPIVLDAAGRPPYEIWLSANTSYKFVVKTSTGTLIRTYDDIPGANDSALLDAFKVELANTSNIAQGDALVGFKQANSTGILTGAVSRTVHDKLTEIISVKDFGAVGDGIADDTIPLQNFFAAVNGKTGYITAGTYKITSVISAGFSNCNIIGVPGASIITGAFDYKLINLLASSNVVFSGIYFLDTYVNPVQDGAWAVVYSYSSNFSNIIFDNCTFSIPNANGNGLVIYLNPNTGGTSTCSGFIVENCTFINIGRQATTFMNRSTQPGASGFFKGLRFNNNLGKNLGLNNNFGMLTSLDGVGEDFTVNNNRLENFYDIGIENTTWKNGEIVGNTFDLMSRLTKPIGIGPSSIAGSRPENISVIRNKCLSPATSYSYFITTTNCYVEDNYFWTNGAEEAVYINSSISSTFKSNVYKNSNPTAARYGCIYFDSSATGCYGNRSFDETFDTSSGTGNFACLRYFGSAALTNNIAYRPNLIRVSGGVDFDEVNGAINNLVVNPSYASDILFGLDFTTQNFTTDADMTLNLQTYSSAISRITNSALTTGRNVILPSIIKQYCVVNATAQILTFKALTGTGIAVAASKTATLFWNGTNMIRITADV